MDTKITLESIDKKIDQKFGLLDRKIDVVSTDIINLKTDLDVVYKKLSSEISFEVKELGDSIRFSLQKVDERLNDKVSYKELELKMAS